MPAEMPSGMENKNFTAPDIKPKHVMEAKFLEVEKLSDQEMQELTATPEGKDYIEFYRFMSGQEWKNVQSESKIDGDNVHISGFIVGEGYSQFEKSLDQSKLFEFDKNDSRMDKVKNQSSKLKARYLETHGNVGQARIMMERGIATTMQRMILATNEYRKALMMGDTEKAEKLLVIIMNDRINIAALVEAGKGWGVKK